METAWADDYLMQRVFEGWRALRRGAVRKMNADFYGSGPDALDPAQMDILDVIASRPRWRMSKLAQALYLDPSTVTRSVDRLAGYGLVMRVSATDDGRGVQVRTTPSGRRLSTAVAEGRRAVMGAILQELSEDECEQLAATLERLVSGIAAYSERLESGEPSQGLDTGRSPNFAPGHPSSP
jgi:DNA-binding MarR family transcriptional regulator